MKSDPIKILHIDSDFNVTYFLFRLGVSIHSSLKLEQAINLLKNEEFDLILSEPHNQAILKPQTFSEDISTTFPMRAAS